MFRSLRISLSNSKIQVKYKYCRSICFPFTFPDISNNNTVFCRCRSSGSVGSRIHRSNKIFTKMGSRSEVSEDSILYFSFGSNLSSERIRVHNKTAVFNAVARLKVSLSVSYLINVESKIAAEKALLTIGNRNSNVEDKLGILTSQSQHNGLGI